MGNAHLLKFLNCCRDLVNIPFEVVFFLWSFFWGKFNRETASE